MTSYIYQILRLSRLWDAAIPIISLFVGAAYVGRINDASLVLLVLVIVLMNSAAIIWNDIEDREIDADNGRAEVLGQSKHRIFILTLAVVGMVAASMIISLLVGVVPFILVLVTIGATWAYNSRPLRLSRRPVLSIIILSATGAYLPFLIGAAVEGITLPVLTIGAWWWLGRISLSVLKDYKDVRGDAKHAKKTFLLRFGARRVAIVSTAAFVIGYGGFILQAGNDVIGVVILCAAMAGLVYMRRPLFDKRASYGELDRTFRQLIQYQAMLDVGVVVWLIS